MIVKLKLLGITILLSASMISAADINGRFVITPMDSSKIAVLLQVNTTTGTEALGGATIVFGFDTTAISLTNNPVKNTDYIFHNFCGGNYSPATITRPIKDRIWVNIDLPYNNSNNGTIVSDTAGWTDAVTIYFDITYVNGTANFYWLSGSPFWSIYKDDNLTLLNPGLFQNIVFNLLPVELSSFTASQIGTNVVVSWTTITEVNNKGFEVERRMSRDNEWESLTFIKGKGTTTEEQSYSYSDDFKDRPIHGTIFYRLKQIDINGRYYYSNEVEVEVDFTPEEFSLYQNYPNPFNPNTKIRWQSPAGSHQTLKVYDILGNEVATLVDEFKPAGNYEVEFNAENLASGVYIYRLQTESHTEIRKMVLLR